MNRFALVLLLLTAASAAARTVVTRPSRLTLSIRPEAAVRMTGAGQAEVKIRLERGTQARLWTADACQSPAPDSFVISASGVYRPVLAGAGRMVCLATPQRTIAVQRITPVQ